MYYLSGSMGASQPHNGWKIHGDCSHPGLPPIQPSTTVVAIYKGLLWLTTTHFYTSFEKKKTYCYFMLNSITCVSISKQDFAFEP